MSAEPRIFRAAEADVRDRGAGVRTVDLVNGAAAETTFVSGFTEFEPGAALGFHHHDCDESVVVIEGSARFELEKAAHELAAGDATLVPAGVPHRFVNAGPGRMRLLFVYGSSTPTRTMLDSGETFSIGSQHDVVSS